MQSEDFIVDQAMPLDLPADPLPPHPDVAQEPAKLPDGYIAMQELSAHAQATVDKAKADGKDIHLGMFIQPAGNTDEKEVIMVSLNLTPDALRTPNDAAIATNAVVRTFTAAIIGMEMNLAPRPGQELPIVNAEVEAQ